MRCLNKGDLIVKYLQMIFLALVVVGSIAFVTTGSNLVYADDHGEKYEKYQEYGEHREGGKHDDEAYEDVGEALGWGTAIAMGAAGIIFILRRSMKTVITKFPDSKSIFISLSKFFGKNHIWIGVIALVLSIIHGVLMFLSEGELDGDGIIGLGSVIFMAIASAIGAVLVKKKKLKSLRTTHTIFIGLAVVIGLIHIIAA